MSITNIKASRSTLFLLILGIALISSGCANLRLSSPPQTQYQTQTPTARYQALKKITRWHINGAFSIQPNNVIANYDWVQQGKQNYVINIYSSLHVYNAVIVGQNNQVTLSTSENKRYRAKTPEALLQQQMKLTLPVSNLYYWVRGLPAPGPYRSQTDRYGHLTVLSQNQWTVQFSRYVSMGGVDLPQILQLNNGQLRIKIVVKNFKELGG